MPDCLVEHAAGRAIELIHTSNAALVGDLRARQLSVLTGALIIFIIAFAFIKWLRATEFKRLLAIGVFWLVLTLGFEVALGRFAMNLSWERILSDYDLSGGGLLGLGMIFMVFAPWLASKISRGSGSAGQNIRNIINTAI